MHIKLAHQIFTARLITLLIVSVSSVLVLFSLYEFVSYLEEKNKNLRNYTNDYKNKVSLLRNNIEKILKIDNIIKDYDKYSEIPVDSTVDLIKNRSAVFQVYTTFNITYPALQYSSNVRRISFNYLASDVEISYKSFNDVILYAFIDDLSKRVNGLFELMSLKVLSIGDEKSGRTFSAVASIRWNMLNLIK